jgi:hypothetical protein
MNFLFKLKRALFVGAGFAAVAFFVSAPDLQFFDHWNHRLPVIIGAGVFAAAACWIYQIWKKHFKKMFFLAALSGLAFAILAHLLAAPDAPYPTIYSCMNFVQPSLQVQKVLTLLGFGFGAVLMLFFGPVASKKKGFSVGFVLGLAAFLGTGYLVSAWALPYLTSTHLPFGSEKTLQQFLVSYGFSVAVLVGAFALGFCILAETNGSKRRRYR